MRLATLTLVALALALASWGVRAERAPRRAAADASEGVCAWDGGSSVAIRREKRTVPLPSLRNAPPTPGDWIPLNTRGYNHSAGDLAAPMAPPAAPAPAAKPEEPPQGTPAIHE